MPTTLPRPQPEQDTRGAQNLAATAAVLAIITLCLWLFYALADANAKLTCVWSGRANCDQQFYQQFYSAHTLVPRAQAANRFR
jgi:hypothetical protein